MTKKYFYFSLSIAFALIFLGGCQLLSTPESTNEASQQTEKKQIVEQTGIIAPKQVSWLEDGTHVLTNNDGEVLYILKSKVEDLEKYENKKVTVKGELNKNSEEGETDIIDVLTINIDEEEDTTEEHKNKIFEIEDAGVRIILTDEWLYKKENDVWNFFTETADNSPIKMEIFPSTSESGQAAITEMEAGVEVTVAGERAFRVLNGNKINVFVIKNGNILLFKFEPQKDEISEKLVFIDLLSNLEWLTNDAIIMPEDEELNVACGGEENNLCPVGYRCELESTEENSNGSCVSVNESSEPKQECPHQTKACPDGTVLQVNPTTCTFANCPEIKSETINEVKTEEPAAVISTNTETTKEEIKTETQIKTTTTEEEVKTEAEADPEPETTTESALEESKTTKEETISTASKEDREIRAPGDIYDTIENTYFSFKIDYPINYYWRHFGATDESISFMGFSDIEMDTIEDAVILVEIRKGAIADVSETARGDDTIILVPRDEESHFRVIGNKEYKANLWKIAQSIEIIEESVQE